MFWQDSFVILPLHISIMDIDFIHPLIKNLPIILSFSAMFLIVCLLYFIRDWPGNYFTRNTFYLTILYPIWFNFASWSFHAGFFNNIYNKIFNLILNISYISINKYLDKGLFEYFGPYGLYKLFFNIRKSLSFNYYSIIFISFMLFVIGLVWLISLISWTLFWSSFLINLGLFPIIIYLFFFNF